MRKAMMVLVFAVLALTCAFAETYTIILVSRVELEMPSYMLRNTETGEMGKSIIYSTSEITKGDVRTGFQIIQTNDSNYRGSIRFTVEATELAAKVDGKVYSTSGVQILMNGTECGDRVEFAKQYFGATRAEGMVVENFEVIWKGDCELAPSTYQAAITMTNTAA